MRFDHDGITFDIDGVGENDHLVRIISRTNRFYEADLLDYMREVCAVDPARHKVVALDVGANIGNHSVYLRRFVAGHVLSFEPNPQVLPTLRRNLERNLPEGGFTVIERALGARPGRGSMTLDAAPAETGYSGMACVVIEDERVVGENGDEGGVLVSTLDEELDKWLEGCPETRPVLLKVDVEGMEPAVLDGAGRTLERWHPDLFLEAGTAEALRTLRESLDELGYTSLCRWGHTPVYHFRHEARLSDGLRARRAKLRARLARLARRIRTR